VGKGARGSGLPGLRAPCPRGSLARALFGKAVGDVVRAGQGEAEVKAIA
jgi:hypothetical protein